MGRCMTSPCTLVNETTACIVQWFAVCTRMCVCACGYARTHVSVHVVCAYVKDHPPTYSIIDS